MAESADADGYFKLMRRLQARCYKNTWKHPLGDKAPILVQGLDTLLSGLDRMASCFGGCRGGDHCAEYLTGRAVSSCTSAMLLMENGYYDEALSIIRSLGELANLMSVFAADKNEFRRWKSINERQRRSAFAPVKIRLWLEKHDGIMVVDEERYRFLSSYSIHASPNNIPQAHNAQAAGSIAPTFEVAGFLLCLNELARAMAFIGVFAPRLCAVPPAIEQALQEVNRLIVEHIGGVNADVKGRPWLKLH